MLDPSNNTQKLDIQTAAYRNNPNHRQEILHDRGYIIFYEG